MGEKSNVLQQGEGNNVAVFSARKCLFTSCSLHFGRCHTSVASSTQPCVGFLVCLPVCTWVLYKGREGAAPPLCPEARRSYSCSWCSSEADSEAAGWIWSVWGCCLCCLRRRWPASRTDRASWRRSCRSPWRMTSNGSWWLLEAVAYRLGAQGYRKQWHGSTSPADWILQWHKRQNAHTWVTKQRRSGGWAVYIIEP